ncbi:hypothetical protein [Nocardioides sp.]|uniref:hypothetical protein n=1 Tax=Nocardioides sp. TaxID=35761 RepID=UPI00286B964D|nr:hypothetical protein [Nocardioides sp.]
MTTVRVFPTSSAVQPVDLPRPLAPLVPTWLWRLAVAASAGAGGALTLTSYGGDARTLPVAASLLVSAVYLVLALVAVVSPRVGATLVRGMLAVLMVLVAGVHLVLLDGSLVTGSSVLLHAVLPVLVVADYVLLARGPVRSWHPLAGLLLPAAYLVAYRETDLEFYEFLAPGAPSAELVVPGLAVVTLGVAFVLGWLASVAD